MPPGLFDAWRAERRLRRRASAYVRQLLVDPADADVAWLSAAATGGDADRARWELRYVRRALGLLAAQRDALDDRTSSVVARALGEAMGADPNVAAGMTRVVERQFNARLRTYGEAFRRRADAESAPQRVGRTFLQNAGATSPAESDLARAAAVMTAFLDEANEALRRMFGVAVLPEHGPPSEALGGPGARRT